MHIFFFNIDETFSFFFFIKNKETSIADDRVQNGSTTGQNFYQFCRKSPSHFQGTENMKKTSLQARYTQQKKKTNKTFAQ